MVRPQPNSKCIQAAGDFSIACAIISCASELDAAPPLLPLFYSFYLTGSMNDGWSMKAAFIKFIPFCLKVKIIVS